MYINNRIIANNEEFHKQVTVVTLVSFSRSYTCGAWKGPGDVMGILSNNMLEV